VPESPNETVVRCPVLVKGDEHGDGMQCDDEIIIEWLERREPAYKTGKRICAYCEEYEDQVNDPNCETFEGQESEHRFEDEWEDGPYTLELISLKTYCFHSIDKEKAGELLTDEFVAAAERRAERD
jgi:hypothetical protein